MRRAGPIALALLTLALPASSTQVEELTRLVNEAAANPNPAMAFLRGAAALPDFKLGQADVQRALEEAGVPPQGPLRQLLGPTLELKKKGDRISIQRSHPTVIAGEGSAIELGKKVEVCLRIQGQEAELDKIDGIRVGERATDLWDLKRVKFTQVNGKPVAVVTAGISETFGLTKTATVPLDGPPAAQGGGTEASAQPQTGFTQVVGQPPR